jgi:hypothetical protein
MEAAAPPGLGFEPRGCTTAMAILPHRDPGAALDLAFSLDVPFWPQLPNVGFSEDTYVQTVLRFPGVKADHVEQTLRFDEDLFAEGLPEYLERCEDPGFFAVRPDDSLTYGDFLRRLEEGEGQWPAVRGQFMGPISLCLKITDADRKPVIYRDEVRELLIRHVAAKVNRHLVDLREAHPRAFVWVDEPGLEILFTGITGYSAERARADLDLFTSLLEGPRGVHLCGNPDWDFLLRSRIDLLSFNAYGTAEVMEGYWEGIKAMLERGGVIAWGMVPTNFADAEKEDAASLLGKLLGLWERLEGHGVDPGLLFSRSMVAPATCCLVNPDLTATVERSFRTVRLLAGELRDRLG